MSMAFGGGGSYGSGGRGDKALRMGLIETLRLAWADPDIRQRLRFVLFVLAVYCLGIHIPTPIPGMDPKHFEDLIAKIPFFGMINTFGGGALKRISIFALGLNPYITSSIIMQILTTAYPQWKKELQEGGEYARKQQNKRTRILTIALCFFQGSGLLTMMHSALPANLSMWTRASVVVFWTAGAMFLLWLGEQISEKGIGNGVSVMIFAGIVISLPNLVGVVVNGIAQGNVGWYVGVVLAGLFVATTWFIVLFTTAQRRIPIQHMKRQIGTKVLGGASSYLPLSINLAGVIPIIFAVSLIYMPAQFAAMFPANTPMHDFLNGVASFLSPDFRHWQGIFGVLAYAMLIFFFNYFYTAIQYNVEDIANNLKRGGSFIPGVRPGKQTRDFLDSVISRITFVGAFFLAIIALTQYLVPLVTGNTLPGLGLLFGTSMLIMVSVALETMRQIEANLLMKQYGQ